MAREYLLVDRDQQLLLPPDMRSWLAPGHLVWFVLDVVARVDTSVLHARHPRGGVGRRAFDPDMLLALLVYSYCMGQRSSRQIERLCEVDVAYRVICANLGPDHSTIARFRQDHAVEAVRLFTEVLRLCVECGLVKVGVVAIDGTKIAGSAALKTNRTRAQVEAELEALISAQVKAMFEDAAGIDAGEDNLFGSSRGDELPAGVADPRSRRAHLDAAVAELDRASAARKAAEDAARQAQIDALRAAGHVDRRPVAGTEVVAATMALELARSRSLERFETLTAAAATRTSRAGRRPVRDDHRVTRALARLERAHQTEAARVEAAAAAEQKSRVNTTDPDSRIMHTKQGWIQGYNAQAAANESGIVIAVDVTQQANDSLQCQPMIAATLASMAAAGITEQIGTLLFDAGYISDDNLNAPGPDRLIATGRSHTLRASEPTNGPPPDALSATAAMEHRLRTPEGAELYSKRQHTIEPVFGTIKEARGYRRFSRRGLSAVKAEWLLIAATHNINKAFHHTHLAC
jgi:transposase